MCFKILRPYEDDINCAKPVELTKNAVFGEQVGLPAPLRSSQTSLENLFRYFRICWQQVDVNYTLKAHSGLLFVPIGSLATF